MKKGILASMLLIMLLLAPAVISQAKGIMQMEQTETKVSIQWDKVESADYYIIHCDGAKQSLQTEETSYTINGLKAGSQYEVRVSYVDVEKDRTKEYYIGNMTIKTTPGKVKNITQSRWYINAEAVNIVWDTQPAVDGYEYLIKDNNGNKIKKKSTKIAAGIALNVHNNTNYNIKVRAYSYINGQKVYGKWSAKAYLFAQPTVKAFEVKDGKMLLKWGKIKNATGYDIYVSTHKAKGYWKVKKINKNQTTATVSLYKGKKFKEGEKYYIAVVAKRKVKKQGRTYYSGRFYAYNTKIKRHVQIKK